MAWREITTADITPDLSPAEIALVQNQQNDPQLAKLTAKIVTVSQEIRGQIKGGGNQVDQSSTFSLAEQVINSAIHVVRWEWINSLPNCKTMQTQNRKDLAQKAQARFASIAAYGDPKRERIELPANADTSAAAVPLPATGHRKYDHDKKRGEDGIV